jgi:hypothetical protein
MAKRVDGPLLTTHSLRDYAVGKSYPAASMANGEDAAAFEDLSDRWGAMGHDGAQNVNAAKLPLSPVGFAYPFARDRGSISTATKSSSTEACRLVRTATLSIRKPRGRRWPLPELSSASF